MIPEIQSQLKGLAAELLQHDDPWISVKAANDIMTMIKKLETIKRAIKGQEELNA